MILLDAAASRFEQLAEPFGVSCGANQLMRHIVPRIKAANRSLNPLALPPELRDFWTWWKPEEFVAPAFDGFFSIDHAFMKRDAMMALGYPANLMPIAAFGKGVIWMELQSADHFGSRCYFGAFSTSQLELWTIGVSGLLELVCDSIERGGLNQWSDGVHTLDARTFHGVLTDHHDDLSAPEGEWVVPIADRTRWPAHWQAVSAR